MLNVLLSAEASADGTGAALTAFVIALIVVGILIGIAVLVGGIGQIMILVGYWGGNRRENSAGKSGAEIARELLDKNGMEDVQVKKCGFFRALAFGNSYSYRKKTIYLRKRIIDRPSLTSAGIAAQKVGLAMQHRDGSKSFLVRARMQLFGLFGPILFIPVTLVGLALDYFVFGDLSDGTPILFILGIVLGFALVIGGFICTLMTIPVEKKGISIALRLLGEEGLMDEDELHVIRRVYRAYMIEYVTQFIIAVLRLIEFLLRVFAQFFALMQKNNKK